MACQQEPLCKGCQQDSPHMPTGSSVKVRQQETLCEVGEQETLADTGSSKCMCTFLLMFSMFVMFENLIPCSRCPQERPFDGMPTGTSV